MEYETIDDVVCICLFVYLFSFFMDKLQKLIQVVYMSRNVEQVFLSRLSALGRGHGRISPREGRFSWNKVVENMGKHVEHIIVKFDVESL